MEHRHTPAISLSDGHAGNRRQAEALARALGHAEAPHLVLAPSRLARALAPRLFPGAARAFGGDFHALLAHPPALAIGCGRQAALATRLLRKAGSRAVQILDPRLDPRHWDAVIAPAHDALAGANVIAPQGSLHEVDDLWLARARHDFPAIGALPAPRIAVLVGGPSRHWAMDDAGFDAALASLAAAARAQAGSLLLAASRRTPPGWREAMGRRDAALIWRDQGDGDNPYRGLLGWADAIVCTADSVNMLSEACATGAPVYVIGGERLQGRPRHFLGHLCDAHRVRAFDGGLTPFAAEPLRESARVAATLRERLTP
ncbi:nucleoside-diphosphate sugar epimerase [Lysobacter pythonis]|uniref:Nucleoside-diphosphate sugar epimerase n=1 Tax=Solilutibacter pythonis TaxID=2483112 RepID=A0A3M2HTR5_9GAMM|nr:mitochondrial fission ELM1 family protein [Lysobacter pythonis]RMH93126.1 nucleoside-diphosphate sugar epimerase [Lysobacter pythonis]